MPNVFQSLEIPRREPDRQPRFDHIDGFGPDSGDCVPRQAIAGIVDTLDA